MIIGLSISPFDTIRLLNISRFRFYLSGSRYFGNSRPDSDWDFFTQDKDGLKDYLESKSFKRVPMKPEWLGSECLAIMRHETGVEIEIQRDWELKLRAQEFIKNDEKKGYLDRLRTLHKYDKGQVWEESYSLLRK